MLFSRSCTVWSPLRLTVYVLPSLTICKPEVSSVVPLPPEVVVAAGKEVINCCTPPFCWAGSRLAVNGRPGTLLIALMICCGLLADAADVEMWTVNTPGVPGLLPEAGVPGLKLADSCPALGASASNCTVTPLSSVPEEVVAPAVFGLQDDAASIPASRSPAQAWAPAQTGQA